MLNELKKLNGHAYRAYRCDAFGVENTVEYLNNNLIVTRPQTHQLPYIEKDSIVSMEPIRVYPDGKLAYSRGDSYNGSRGSLSKINKGNYINFDHLLEEYSDGIFLCGKFHHETIAQALNVPVINFIKVDATVSEYASCNALSICSGDPVLYDVKVSLFVNNRVKDFCNDIPLTKVLSISRQVRRLETLEEVFTRRVGGDIPINKYDYIWDGTINLVNEITSACNDYNKWLDNYSKY